MVMSSLIALSSEAWNWSACCGRLQIMEASLHFLFAIVWSCHQHNPHLYDSYSNLSKALTTAQQASESESRPPKLSHRLITKITSPIFFLNELTVIDIWTLNSPRSQARQTLLIFWWTKYVQSSNIAVYSERIPTHSPIYQLVHPFNLWLSHLFM